jgi:16S rRNA processing protein RimM
MRVGDIRINCSSVDQKHATDAVTIGRILSAVGLRGEVKCSLLTDFPERFNGLRDVTIGMAGGTRHPYQIERVRFASQFVYLRFVGVTSMEEAERLRGGEIQVSEEERVALPADHYYHDDLIGLDVFSEAGQALGKLVSVLETGGGGNDVYLVQQGEQEYLIPAMKSVVKKIDLTKKVMTICPMEGLLDLQK